MIKICIWPDDAWCDEDDYGSIFSTRSDDYRVVEVSDDWDYDEIEEFVYQLNRCYLD